MSRLTHCDVLRVSTNVLLRDWIINTNWPLRESRDIRVVIVSHKVLLLSGGRSEDMRDFIWLPRSYLINSWIQQNLSRVATTTSPRGIEHGPDQDIPPDIRLRKGVSGPGTNQRPVWPALTNQRPVSRGECLHCRGSAEPAPTHPCLSLSCTPVNTCQKLLARTQTEFAALNWITPTTFTKYDEKENVQSFTADKINPLHWHYPSISRQSILISITFSHQLDTKDW